jgi:Asp-tRNA(Asn)/Glu-tRNA(Gln) amidotransferase A subunit family amidase
MTHCKKSSDVIAIRMNGMHRRKGGDMTLLKTIEDLRSGKIDLLETLDAYCDCIDAREPDILAIVPGTFDRRRVREAAEALLRAYPDPDARPPLFGLPVGVKDIIRVDGFPTRCGSALPGELFDGPEADCIRRLKRAGAIMMAKTVTTEFAYNEPGPTRNPYNLEHTPGGSSSGSAAGVASGFFPLALGSQTVGSVIRPAAFCGIVGVKPSCGRISIDGVIPYSVTVDHVGIFCKDPSGIDTVMSVMIDGWQAYDGKISARDTVLGTPEGPYMDRLAPNGRAFFEKQVERLTQAGFCIRRVSAFTDFGNLEQDHRHLIAAEMARYHEPWFEAHRSLYRPRTREQIDFGLTLGDAELEALRDKRLQFRDSLESRRTADGIDFWICPPATDHAPKGLENTGNAVMNLPWTSAGVPVVTLPAGLDGDGLPQGIQVAGRFMEDEKLVSMAGDMFAVLSDLSERS